MLQSDPHQFQQQDYIDRVYVLEHFVMNRYKKTSGEFPSTFCLRLIKVIEMILAEPVTDDPLHTLYLASAEDVILHKLYWFQLGDRVSERQWHDVLGVIQVQYETLDYHYLEQTAQNLRVGELLHRALKEADMGEASG